MNTNDMVKLVVCGIAIYCGLNVTLKMTGAAINGTINGVNKLNYKRKIKKGLKDGSIIEIDGQYYEVEIS